MPISLTQQVLSFAGAVIVLIAYSGHQFHWMDSHRPLYNAMNTAGGLLLAWAALHPFQVGFMVMEGSWTVISLIGLYKALAGTTAPART